MSRESSTSAFVSFPRRWVLAAALGAAIGLLAPSLPAQVRVPGFKPSTSGFHFANNFPEIPLLTIDIPPGIKLPIGNASKGLCGGMVYACRDYFDAGLLPPPNVTDGDGLSRPPQVVFDYLVKRLFDSFDLPGGPLKYLHLMNPDLPDHETDASRLGITPHGRAWVMIVDEWPLIKADLDSGLLSPMAFIRVKDHDPFKMGENHQILAYGYDLSWPNLTIHVYDPNYPDRDDVNISLSIADPQHTTTVTYSLGDTLYCFMHTRYVWDNPPVTSCSSSARAGSSLATGIDASGTLVRNGLADPAYEVMGPTGPFTCATVVPDDQFPIGPWAATTAGSKWVGLRRLSSNGPAGRYAFRIQIDLPAGTDTSRMGIIGSWSADDLLADVLVNGASSGISGPGNFTALQPFPARAALGMFRPGRNTVDFIVDNGSSSPENPVGLRVEASVAAFPEPDLYVLQLAAGPASVLPGGSCTVDLITANGGGLACAATVTRLRLIPAGGGAPISLGDVNVPDLCAGCGASASVALTVPAQAAPGTYSIEACAEAAGAVAEGNEGNNCGVGNTIVVQSSQPPRDCYREDFESRLLPDWTAPSGDWRISSGRLAGTGTNDEAWIWSAGLVPADPAGQSYNFDMELLDAGGDPAVGRHGGVMFCSTSPTSRWDGAASGYTLDWIDRASDHGLRLHRIDNGVETPLHDGTRQLSEPPANWRILLDAQRIEVFADGVLVIAVTDATYRGGRFGIWAYNGQSVRIDNLTFGSACGGVRKPFDLSPNGEVDIADCVNLLGFLYLGQPAALPCGDGTTHDAANRILADYNGDGEINLTDPVAALHFLFLGGAPAAAGQTCLRLEGCPDAPTARVCMGG